MLVLGLASNPCSTPRHLLLYVCAFPDVSLCVPLVRPENPLEAFIFRGLLGEGVTGRVAVESRKRRVQTSRIVARNPLDPH
eukprot:scaffold218078_cov17-Tisochrysis_lutea.AAC.1